MLLPNVLPLIIVIRLFRALLFLKILIGFCHSFCTKNLCQNLWSICVITQGGALGYNDFALSGLILYLLYLHFFEFNHRYKLY